MSTASQQEQGKKGSDAPRSASKRKASGSHCPQGKATGEGPKGPKRLGPSSRLLIRMPPGSTLELGLIMSQCPKVGLRCRFAALALTRPSSMS